VKKKLLFVDDEPHFLAGIRRMLRTQRDQWDMEFVHSVDAAFARACEGDLDVVVSDIQMPGKDGFDLLRLFAGDPRTEEVPVIILTGNAEEGLKRKALELGAADLLNKPVRAPDLLARLRSTLRLKAYQDEIKAQNAVLDLRVRERTVELEASRLDILFRLGKAAEFRDEETGNHVLRVGRYCQALARRLDLGEDLAEMLLYTAPLHDIGKIGVPDRVLLKPGKLDADEWALMQRHCEIGASLLLESPAGLESYLAWRVRDTEAARNPLRNPILEHAARIALAHHEKWDGQGYPRGLAGEAIPIEARITAVADVYDALRSDRPYKRAFPEAKAFEIICSEAGTHFDPGVCAAFEAVREAFDAIRAQDTDGAPSESDRPSETDRSTVAAS